MKAPPSFYEEDRFDEVYIERADDIQQEAVEYRNDNDVDAAGNDDYKIGVFGIDCQVGFCHPEASLAVPGAPEDMRKATEWIYRNLEDITQLQFSMDTHYGYQIFHPAWWIDEDGENPDPNTVISYDDVKSGKWRPVANLKKSIEYVKKLEEQANYQLTIWPNHTLLGGASHMLVPPLMEASLFHSFVRQSQTHFETKGTNKLTEHYSVMGPEVTELRGEQIGSFNARFFDKLMNFDRLYIFGEAKSHCVRATILDILDEIEDQDPSLAEKVYILEDAMSPVPPPMDNPPPELDFPAKAEEAIEQCEKSGMNVTSTSEDIDI